MRNLVMISGLVRSFAYLFEIISTMCVRIRILRQLTYEYVVHTYFSFVCYTLHDNYTRLLCMMMMNEMPCLININRILYLCYLHLY